MATPLWKKFCAGFLSGSVGALVANPADLLKVRLQSIEGQQKQNVMKEVQLILKD
jgi:type IV pilus biogenesis protein CpaD/CtpE